MNPVIEESNINNINIEKNIIKENNKEEKEKVPIDNNRQKRKKFL